MEIQVKSTTEELLDKLTLLLAEKDGAHLEECKSWYNLGVEVGRMMKGEK